MTQRTAANRYGRALFDVALKEQQDLAAIDRELSAFLDLVRRHPTFEKVLLNPAIPAARKRAAVAAVLGQAPKMSPVVGKLLVLLAERDRLVILPDLIAAYRNRVLDFQKVVRAEVVTAEPLSAERAKAVELGLAQLSGRNVLMEARVDPALVGGVVARIGSTVYDASVVMQLNKMRRKLIESM